MSKKVLIILGIAIALLISGVLLLMYEKNKEIDELQNIEDTDPEPKKKVTKVKPITVVNIDEPINKTLTDNGTDNTDNTETKV